MVKSYGQRFTYNRSLVALFHPRGQARVFGGALIAGVFAGWFAMTRLQVPLWVAVAATVVLLLYPAARKWRLDRQQLGTPVMVLSILVATQALHTVEHIAQWVQYHLLGWPLKASSGLISPLNAEIVHFSWNLSVLLVVLYLLEAGVRNRWMWLLLVWATAHTFEHTYLFINYVQEVGRLRSAGLPLDAAQGLPGILGRNGWLASNNGTSTPITWICTVAPGLASAPRLDVHFWWNVGETALLFAAGHMHLRRVVPSR